MKEIKLAFVEVLIHIGVKNVMRQQLFCKHVTTEYFIEYIVNIEELMK